MSIANKLYDRSHGFVGDVNATNPNDLPSLYISGTLRRAIVKQRYSGRLKVNNAVGAYKVKLLSGNLPNGWALAPDLSTQEIVLTWPSYASEVATIPNYNFEQGDDGSWEMGAGFEIMSGETAPDPNDPGSSYQAKFSGVSGESQIMSVYYFPVGNNTAIKASVDVQQGASSANKAGAAVRILFYDGVGFQVGGMDGNVIKSGSDSEWKTSTVNSPVPANAVYARIGASAYRKSQNKPLWVDNLVWDLEQPSVGTDSTAPIPLSVEVVDSIGRVAVWSGIITVSPPIQVINYNVSSDDFVTSVQATKTFKYLTYHKGKFIGVSDTTGALSCPVYSSDDGINYTQVGALSLPGTNCVIYGIVSTPTSVVILENWSGMYRSIDSGVTWTRVLTSSNTWGDNGFFYSNGLMVAAGSGGVPTRYSLDDGLTWIATDGAVVSSLPCGLAYFNGSWIGAGVDKGTLTPSFCQFNGAGWAPFTPSVPPNMQQVGLIAKVGQKIYIVNRLTTDYHVTTDFVNYQHYTTPGSVLRVITGDPNGRTFAASPITAFVEEGGVLVNKGAISAAKYGDQFLFLE